MPTLTDSFADIPIGITDLRSHEECSDDLDVVSEGGRGVVTFTMMAACVGGHLERRRQIRPRNRHGGG